MKKDLIGKLLPLIDKFKGKKPIVLILSAVAIAACIFAVQKGYIAEGSIDFGSIIDQINNAFADSTIVIPVDSIISPVDTLAIEVVDSIITQ
jgi:hypothetical protein